MPIGRARATAIAASLLTFALALSGCQNNEVPASTTIPTTPPSSSAMPQAPSSGSPSPTSRSTTSKATPSYEPATSTSPAKNVPKPVMPKLAKEKSFEGQKAFIKYWFETYNYAFDTGDYSLFAAASASDCEACKTIRNGVATMWEKHETWPDTTRSEADIINAKHQPDPDALSILDVRVKDHPGRFWNKNGESTVYKKSQGGTALMRLWIEYIDGEWRTVDMGRIGD